MVINTINSILNRSFYPNFELIVVDNNSDSKTKNTLLSFSHIPKVKLIFNPKNYGFSKGNNIGLKQATGDYLILINNDVLVTPGWINRLINHYQYDTGLVGPVTNSIGNEAKIDIDYNPFEIKDLEKQAFKYTSAHWGETLENNTIAAFCWIMSKSIYTKIGDLDERFGRGFFEDDDYCLRVRNAGYKVLIANDTFIHHYGGTSFKQIQSQEYQNLFNENKLKFEDKWNTKWIPHQYRK
jgi:GT2 family glycosyltransferase